MRDDSAPVRDVGPGTGILIDLSIRFTGVVGVIASAVLFAWLYRLIRSAPGTDPSFGAYLLAAAAFLMSSGGSAIMVLGHHVNDRIELAERWRPRI